MNEDMLQKVLHDEEKVLWQEKSTVGLRTPGTFLFLGVVMLGITALLPIEEGVLGFSAEATKVLFGLLTLVLFVAFYSQRKFNANTYYLLTNQRAMVVESISGKAKPFVCEVPLLPMMVKSCKLHRSGCKDYVLFKLLVQRSQKFTGFMKVRDTDGLESAFKELGVQLPELGAKHADKMTTVRHEYAPLSAMVGYMLGVALFAHIVLLSIESNGIDLFWRGQPAKAYIVGYKDIVEKAGRHGNQEVEKRYPILAYPVGKTNPVIMQALDLQGDAEYDWAVGDMVDMMYDPDKPTRAMRGNDKSILLSSGICAAVELYFLNGLISAFRRWRRTKNEPCYVYKTHVI